MEVRFRYSPFFRRFLVFRSLSAPAPGNIVLCLRRWRRRRRNNAAMKRCRKASHPRQKICRILGLDRCALPIVISADTFADTSTKRRTHGSNHRDAAMRHRPARTADSRGRSTRTMVAISATDGPVAVTGVSGYTGGHMVRELVHHGYGASRPA